MRFCVVFIVSAAFLLGMGGSPARGEETVELKQSKSQRSLERMDFGKTPDGTPVDLYVLTNGKMTAKVMTYGAIVTEIDVPDRHGKMADVVLGFDTSRATWPATRISGRPPAGSPTGSPRAKFTLDGKEYKLAVNNGPNTLHGGLKGFDKVVWKAEDVSGPAGPAVKLTYLSPDGEEGFPGQPLGQRDLHRHGRQRAARSTTRPRPTRRRRSTSPTTATSTWPGPASGTILGHELMLAADQYTPVDDDVDPDRRSSRRSRARRSTSPGRRRSGSRIAELKGEPGGYDHNYVLRSDGKAPALAARVTRARERARAGDVHDRAGRAALHGNFLDGTLKGKGGVVYKKHQAFCLEAQHFPDSVNHPKFPSTILRPGIDVYADDDLQVLAPARCLARPSAGKGSRGVVV